MKKYIFITLLIFMGITTIFAEESKHNLGIVAGTVNGLSYKVVINNNFAAQIDLGIGFSLSPFLSQVSATGGKLTLKVNGSQMFWDFSIRPNLMYQGQVYEGLSLFAGGGTTLGFGTNFSYRVGNVRYDNYAAPVKGKFGVNAIMGMEYKLSKAPVILGMDFRPGYGMLFKPEIIEDVKVNSLIHYFDWNLALAIRYCF